VLVKVKAAGVCHSDLHIWEGATISATAESALAERSRRVAARNDGHETVGEVLAFGPDAKGDTGGSQGRRRRAGLSLARLRQMRDLSGGR